MLIFFLVVAIFISGVLIQRPPVQHYLLEQLSKKIDYDIGVDRIEVNLVRGIGISAYGIKIKPWHGSERCAADKAIVTFNIRDLIRGRIIPSGIFLVRPEIVLPAKKGQFPLEKGKGSKENFLKALLAFPSVSIADGTIYMERPSLRLDDLYIEISRKDPASARLELDLHGTVIFKNGKAPVDLEGIITPGPDMNSGISAELTVKAGDVPLTWVNGPEFLSVDGGYGEISIDIKARSGESVDIKGDIHIDEPHFYLHKSERMKEFFFPYLSIDFVSLYSNSNGTFRITDFEIKGPEFLLNGNADLNLRDSSGPRLSLKVDAPFMPLEAFKKIFPTQLVARWIETELFPIIRGGVVRVDMFRLNGTLDQIKDLTLPDNTDVLLMKVSWKGFEVLKDAGGLPFEAVSGKMSIENGGLLISGVKGNFGRSTIADGALNIPSLFQEEARDYDVRIDGSFDLADIIRQGKIDLVPIEVYQRFQKFRSVSGRLEAHMQLHYNDNTMDYPRLLKGNFRFRDCSIIHDELPLPLSLTEGELGTDQDGQSRFHATGSLGNSRLSVKGSWTEFLKDINADIEGALDLNEIMGLFHKNGEKSNISFRNPVVCSLSLEGHDKTWSGRGKIDLGSVILSTSYFSMAPVKDIGKATFSAELVPGKKIFLKHFDYETPRSAFDFSGFWDMEDHCLKFKTVTHGDLLDDLGIKIKCIDMTDPGSVECSAEAIIPIERLEDTHVTGLIDGKRFSFGPYGDQLLVSDCDFKMKFSGKDISISLLRGRLGKNNFELHGDLNGWDGLKGCMVLNMDSLDISDLIASGIFSCHRKGGTSGHGRFVEHSDVQLELKVAKGSWEAIRFGPLEAEGFFRSGDFYIKSSLARLDHGLLKVTGHVKTGGESEIFLNSYLKMTDQPVKDIFLSLGFDEDYMNGHLTTESEIAVRGGDAASLVSGMNGGGKFTITNGKVRKSRLIFNILDFLSLQKILDKRPSDLIKEGFYFDSLEGNVSVENGICKLHNIIMKSPAFNAVAEGKVDMPGESLDFDLVAQPFGTIDSLVSKVPVVGYIITGKDKKFLVYSFKVKGPWSKPEVKYVPLKDVGNGTVGFLKRLFFTPGRIFKDMSNITREIVKKGVPGNGD